MLASRARPFLIGLLIVLWLTAGLVRLHVRAAEKSAAVSTGP